MRDEKVKVLKAIPAIEPKNLVRGQFVGYLDEKGVAKDSKVETFAALAAGDQIVAMGRGAVLYSRGKKSSGDRYGGDGTVAQATHHQHDRARYAAELSALPHQSRDDDCDGGVGCAARGVVGKREEVELVASRHPRPGEMEAYERVLTDAMAGDATVFARQDYVEEAWRIVDPMLKAATPVYSYEPHTWGPKEVDSNIVPPGGWEVPVAEDLEDFRIVKQSA